MPVVVGILLVLAGLSLALYGGLFYMTVREPVEYEMPLERHRREQEMLIYQILLFSGIPVLALGVLLWIVYLFRTGRCRYCPLCPGAKKRRRRREEFEAQVRTGRGFDSWMGMCVCSVSCENQGGDILWTLVLRMILLLIL